MFTQETKDDWVKSWNVQSVSREIAGRTLTIETNRIAKQAAGAVTVQYGDSMVLVAVTSAPPRPGLDFFPLTVDYRERGAAAGRIMGGRFLKREGRPTEREILTCRCIDRPIRPLFPKGYISDIVISATVISADQENDPDVLAMIGASAALSISKVPFKGPTGSVRVGRKDGEFVVFPSYKDTEEGDLNLVLSAKSDAIVMVESSANILPEDVMIEGLEVGHDVCKQIIEMQEELVAKLDVEKEVFVEAEEPELNKTISEKYLEEAKTAASTPGKFERRDALKALSAKLVETYADDDDDAKPSTGEVKSAFSALQTKAIRTCILENKRIDGRTTTEVRPIEIETAFLPRTHGSALFTRGETQAMVSTTLGTEDDAQLVEGMFEMTTETFLLHYNFPGFSVGESKPPRGPGRREIGHGKLAWKALKPVLPNKNEFPYTLRILSDITESNGSSSMATVCGGAMSMLDAGVPLKSTVAGIAMGLVKEGDEYVVLTDILGDEDHYGDMDFKVTGTSEGITALQMDIKIDGLPSDVMARALGQAREGRLKILDVMNSVLPTAREDVSKFAPRIIQIQIDKEKIGKLIGPGGKTINGLQEGTGAKIEVNDDGVVTVSSTNLEKVVAAQAAIEGLFVGPRVGTDFDGVVKSIRDFGAFVEILPGVEALVHVSELDLGYVKNPNDVCKEGENMRVRVIKVDDQGRIKCSRKVILAEEKGDSEE